MKLILIFISALTLLSSCSAQETKSLTPKQRDAKIVTALLDVNKKKGLVKIDNIYIISVDSLTASEYFNYTTKKLKKLIEVDEQFAQLEKSGMETDSILLSIEKDNYSKYQKHKQSYNENKHSLDTTLAGINLMKMKVDSFSQIIRSSGDAFMGYYIKANFQYTDNGKSKSQKIEFLSSKDFIISTP